MLGRLIFSLAAAAIAATPAFAREHSFVASYGNDSNACSYLEPCATFQQALSVTVAGGEISAIDSDGFGSLVINQSVTITGAPGAEANVPTVSGGSSVVINGSVNVTLRNLTINGEGVGYNGIEIDSAGSVTVVNCTITNFYDPPDNTSAGNGIWMNSGSVPNLTVTNSVLSNNGQAGISIGFPANALINNAVVTGNTQYGILDFQSGYDTTVAIANSFISDNGFGIFIEGYATTTSIDNTVITGNGTGIYSEPSGNPEMTVLLGRSVITGNTQYGVNNQVNGFTNPPFYSYDDNRINGNGTADDEFGTALNTTTHKVR
jgi:parallel beta helix pectate lyase-like protein